MGESVAAVSITATYRVQPLPFWYACSKEIFQASKRGELTLTGLALGIERMSLVWLAAVVVLFFRQQGVGKMSMAKGVTAWEKEPQRQMRSFVIRVFCCGFALGMGIGEIRFDHFHIVWAEMQVPANRWWGVGICVLSAVLGAWAAWDYYWKKIA